MKDIANLVAEYGRELRILDRDIQSLFNSILEEFTISRVTTLRDMIVKRLTEIKDKFEKLVF